MAAFFFYFLLYNIQMIIHRDYRHQFGIFHDLIKFRVREILLVSSFYDAFVLEEDGRLSEKIFSEYVDLNLTFIPRIVRVSSAEEALKMIGKHTFDLVITMTRIVDMNPLEFGAQVKKLNPEIPVILLTNEWFQEEQLIQLRESKSIDKVFYWTGDTRILLAIIKYIEDLKNVDNDIRLGVRVIFLIEDSPRFYSNLLPLIYTEIMTQTRRLIAEGVNDLHRQLRMRARPKILMAETYEQGMELYGKYKENLLGIISDLKFPRNGKVDDEAGFVFARKIKKDIPDLPFLIQSSYLKERRITFTNGLDFLDKNSDNLLHDLMRFILSNFGFGDFVFKDPGGREICRAKNLYEFKKMIQKIPEESLIYHAERNHISIWMRARTEFEAAERLRPMKVSDFRSVDDLRKFILQEVQRLIHNYQHGVITDFQQIRFDSQGSFIRLGSGSLGGKARGIAFLNTLLAQTALGDKFRDITVKTPQTFVICSDVFEEFIRANGLQEFSILESEDEKIAGKFQAAELPEKILGDLETLLENIKYPVAIRSSSILEDSQMLPFAGLYSTYMLPNNNTDLSTRLKQLSNAIKHVFASVFYKPAREYIRNTNFRIEEEKMAVIIQELVGQDYNGRFYPVISGVAQSYNFYPYSHMKPEDGIVQLALGLGIIIVEGARVYRFSPAYPGMNPPFSSVKEYLKKSQNYFYALDLLKRDVEISHDEKLTLGKFELKDAEKDGTLHFVASTYHAQDDAIRDSVSTKGPRVLTFAKVLKYDVFPLAGILKEILKIGYESFGSHIEIEFALNLHKDAAKKPEFNLLQIRPMIAGRESMEVSLDGVNPGRIICKSIHSMGNGIFKNLTDIVYVDPERFNPSKSQLIADEVGKINQKFIDADENYILIGFGRWGTSDPRLGIPVKWHQISKAKVIIESNLKDFYAEPSQGSHFFHNMTSLKLGYFHIKDSVDGEFIMWNWIKKQRIHNQTEHVRHIRFPYPLLVKIDARVSTGVVLKSDDC